jgi:hypothetical protein
MRAGLVPRASFRRWWTVPIDPARPASGSKSATPQASPCSGSVARTGIGNEGGDKT